MYHDQALIPIKTVAFEDAVDVTLGLPIVRTSPRPSGRHSIWQEQGGHRIAVFLLRSRWLMR